MTKILFSQSWDPQRPGHGPCGRVMAALEHDAELAHQLLVRQQLALGAPHAQQVPSNRGVTWPACGQLVGCHELAHDLLETTVVRMSLALAAPGNCSPKVQFQAGVDASGKEARESQILVHHQSTSGTRPSPVTAGA